MAMRDRKADALVFLAGQRAQLRFGKNMKPLVKQILNAAQIRALLSEVVPQADLDRLDAGQEVHFQHEIEDVGPFEGVAGYPGGVLVVKLQPLRRAASSSPSAPVIASVAAPARVQVQACDGDAHPIDALFRGMTRAGASDLHLAIASRPAVRIDGDMTTLADQDVLDDDAMERLVGPIMPARNRKQFEECSDTDFAYELPGVARFRCNVFRDRHGMAAVFRVIPSRIMTADELGLPAPVQNLCYLSKGLVLVTGPTGSGKSTTLATLVDIINRERQDHIITIEDPIEFVHGNQGCVNQREVGVHTASFKSALRAALREDPDVVLVGEMRDLETISIAIETALTGHLVFGTLHTSTAVQTVDRIIDQFPGDRQPQVRSMLADCLKGVISQTLLRRRGGGRIAALEVLLGTQSTSHLIREGKTFQIPSVMQTSRNIGMATLNDVLIQYVKDGLVEPKEAYVKAVDKDNLVSLFERNGIKTGFLHAVGTVKTGAAMEKIAV